MAIRDSLEGRLKAYVTWIGLALLVWAAAIMDVVIRDAGGDVIVLAMVGTVVFGMNAAREA